MIITDSPCAYPTATPLFSGDSALFFKSSDFSDAISLADSWDSFNLRFAPGSKLILYSYGTGLYLSSFYYLETALANSGPFNLSLKSALSSPFKNKGAKSLPLKEFYFLIKSLYLKSNFFLVNLLIFSLSS